MSVRQYLQRLRSEERGQTILTFAFLFVVLLGFTAMVVDAGVVYWNRRLLQNAVDAAALAGAGQLPNDPNAAIKGAVAYAQNNGVSTDELICDPNYSYPITFSCANGSDATYGVQVTQTYSPNDTLLVSARRHVDFGLRYIVGAGDTDVVATASSIVAALRPGDLAPWAVRTDTSTVCNPGTMCTLHLTASTCQTAGDCQPGNFQAIDFDGCDLVSPPPPDCSSSGGSGYRDNLIYGYQGPIPAPVSYTPSGDPIYDWKQYTEPGGMIGPTKQAVDQLFTWDNAQECDNGVPCADSTLWKDPPSDGNDYNPSPNNVDGKGGLVCYDDLRCPRVVLVPFVSGYALINGKDGVTIVGFGCFYLTSRFDTSQGSVTGIFINPCHNMWGTAMYGVPVTTSSLQTRSVAVFLWR